MFYLFCTLLRRDLPLPELLYTIYKLLLVVRFYFSFQVELEFTPQGFHGLKVRTHQRECATSWFFPRGREFSLAYACASGHYSVWTGARNFNNSNKRNKRRLWNIAKEIGKMQILVAPCLLTPPTHEQWRGDRALVADNHVVESVATL